MSLIDIEGAVRDYRGHRAVDGATLGIATGRVTCLLGASGSGKSTLLRLVAGLEPIDGGSIVIEGRMLSGRGLHVPPDKRNVGFVFQDFALFPHLSIADNVGFGLTRLGRAERASRIAEELERVRLGDKARAFPHQLSGGEQQRVAIARALARRPAVMLLDEPFSGLDAHLKGQVRDDLLATLRSAGATAVIVTHDAEEALMMADDLSLMAAGRIIQSGVPHDVYLRPATMTAARLTGEVVALPARIEGGTARCAFGAIAAEGAAGEVLIAARPEAFAIADDGVEARIIDARFSGAATVARIEAAGVSATMRLHPSHRPSVGECVKVALNREFCAIISP